MAQMNIEELKVLIAKGIREQNLHEALPENAVEIIKQKILSMRDKEYAKQIPEIVSELEIPSVNYRNTQDTQMPDERELATSPEQQINISGNTQPGFFVDAGSTPTDTPIEPEMGYTPELPEMLKKAAPGELFVFQYNDIGESGENLSYKPMRLMSDPDVKKSMQDLWVQEGKTRAKVYVAKFEEIGEIQFNYTSGTSSFIERASLPDFAGGTEYKDNPYSAESIPQIDDKTQKGLETYIKNTVDLEKVVNNIVMDIIKTSLMTPSELSDTGKLYPLGAIDPNDPNRPMDNKGYYVNEDFTLSISDLIGSDEYEKVVLPKDLNESIKSGKKLFLQEESDSVQKWNFDGKIFYTPTERLSKDKGYIKL